MDYLLVDQISNLEGKVVLVRFDFNVSLEEGRAKTDDKRLVGVKKTIDYIVGQGAKLVMMSHLGRPKGKVVAEFSLEPVAYALTEILGKEVKLAPDCIGPDVEATIKKMQNGDILLLENLRFHPEEEENDPDFSRQLGKLADVYIDDAFGTMHRSHASVHGVVEYMKSQERPVGIGYLVEEELKTFAPIVNSTPKQRKQTVIIIGGKKLAEKMLGATQLPKDYGLVIVGGMPYNVFQLARGYNVGNSMVKEEKDDDYTRMAREAFGKHKNIVLPEDIIIAEIPGFLNSKDLRIGQEIPEGFGIAGVVPDESTLAKVKNAIYIINFGTLGVVEQGITKGDLLVAQAIRENPHKPFVLYCGGDAAKLPKKLCIQDLDLKISTGGGSAMEYVIYRRLPALDILEIR